MSNCSSPLNGSYDAAEPSMRLSVRKDLFPDDCLQNSATDSDEDVEDDQVEGASFVKLETDFEQSIDEIAHQKLQTMNGTIKSPPSHRKRHKSSRHDSSQSTLNGYLPTERKRKKKSHKSHSRPHKNNSIVSKVKGGKNLNLVSSSECQEDEEELDESESSEDEVLKSSVKLRVLPRQSGKPYSHELSQLSSKKSKSRNSAKEHRRHVVIPCSGKPRSMLNLCSSRSKKKSKKSECTATYQSQIVDTSTKLKIKIRKTGTRCETLAVVAPTPSVVDLPPKKSKKKRAASPVPSESSGEEYDPSRGETSAVMSVAAPKPRHSRQAKNRKPNSNTKCKEKAQKTERSRGSEREVVGPQSPWALSKVCKLWHSVSCKPELWKHVDLAQHTLEKFKTDYKLVWLLENRLSRCQSLNLAHWDVNNINWVLTCLMDYCQDIEELNSHCPNIEVLDISGAQATSHPANVPLEALQKGCPKMRVFRAANAQLVLAPATTSQQELSIAGAAAAERTVVGEYRFGEEALGRLVRGAVSLRLLDLRGLHRLTDSGLVRVPAWDLQHLFLGGCNITRNSNACLELICEKWSHSLIELDLSWASHSNVLDPAVSALADATESKLRILNLFGSSVSLEPVKKVLLKCHQLESINLSLCRALPRGMKRLYTGKELENLKVSLDPNRAKSDDDSDDDSDKKTKKGNSGTVKSENVKQSPQDKPESSTSNLDIKSPDKSSPSVFQEPRSVSEVSVDKHSSLETQIKSPVTKVAESKDSNDIITSANEAKRASRSTSPKLASPLAQSKPDSSSTPRSEPAKADLGSPHFSPVQKPDSQVPNSPDVQSEQVKSNSSWNLFKRTPTYKSEASPINRLESHSKIKHAKVIEQCSPTTSLENKPSPETLGLKPDIKNPNSWNYGNYSPMPRQDNQFSSQRSPYSAQPSPAQPSPYSQTQPSPYSTQPSPYSSQPSPYSAQPSPDTSQIIKPDLPKSGAWNTGNYSPLPKHHAPFSPHPSTHTSPDPGLAVKGDNLRSSSTKTPGQYSPMSRHHQSPYSPRPSVDNSYSNKKSPGVGKRSPLVRPDCHLPSPDGGHGTRHSAGRTQDMYNRSISKAPEVIQNVPPPDLPTSWGLDRYNQLNTPTTGIESLVWGSEHFGADPMTPHIDNIPSMLNTAPPTRSQPWNDVSHFDTGGRRPNDVSDPWTLGQFRIEPPHQMHNTFVEQNISFESLSSHVSHQQLILDTSPLTQYRCIYCSNHSVCINKNIKTFVTSLFYDDVPLIAFTNCMLND
ncbi:unnamed protein product [Leptidea sinapis]|uniref:F-box domain-containing protein n=1 Tax=Leptidea sinapis TaxID=189913 RepID=A0A5E4Q5C3_9NEOP|nr:unnamed protein product [Leptidea sinapis]